jgi:hypothetical protein
MVSSAGIPVAALASGRLGSAVPLAAGRIFATTPGTSTRIPGPRAVTDIAQ